MRTLTIPWGTIHCHRDVANAEFVPRTGWIRIGDIQKLRVEWEMASAMSNARLEFAFQLAKDEGEAPGPTVFVAKGGALTANGMKYTGVVDITADLGQNLLIRFGFKAFNGSEDNVLVCAAAGGTVEYMSC